MPTALAIAAHPDDIDVGERGSQRELFKRPVGGNPKLTLFETGRNVGVCFRVDVRVDAECDSRLGSDGSRHFIKRLQLGRGLDVEHENVGLQGIANLLRVLADARKNDL